MAAKVKKVKLIKVIRDDAAAKEAMKIVGKPLKAVNEAMDLNASNTSQGAAQRNQCALMYAWGLGIKETNKNMPFNEKMYNDRFDAYAAKHWPSTDTQPSEGTLDGYKAQYKAFAEAAWAKFDAREAVQENLAIANVQMPWRAARMRELIKLDAKPSKDKLAEVFKITKAAGSTSNMSGDTAVARFVTAGITLANDPKVRTFLGKNAHIAEWLEPILRQLIAVRKTDTKTLARAPAKAAVEKAEKVFPAIAARGNARANARANVAGHGRA